MRVCVFGWLPRDEYPGKPPYFGGMPTWVYLKKFNLNSLEEEKIKKILEKIDSQIGADKYKVVVYDGNRIYSSYFFVRVDENE
jgi:hypothetical protein